MRTQLINLNVQYMCNQVNQQQHYNAKRLAIIDKQLIFRCIKTKQMHNQVNTSTWKRYIGDEGIQ